MHVKSHHPLQELLAQLFFSIETVPAKEQRRMVSAACKEAVKWHRNQVNRMQWWIKDMEGDIRKIDGVCPECDRRLGDYINPYHPGVHKKDCDLGSMIVVMEEELRRNREGIN